MIIKKIKIVENKEYWICTIYISQYSKLLKKKFLYEICYELKPEFKEVKCGI